MLINKKNNLKLRFGHILKRWNVNFLRYQKFQLSLNVVCYSLFIYFISYLLKAGNLGTMGVRLQRTYHSLLDPDEEIEFDQRLKAYKYGRTLVLCNFYISYLFLFIII